MKRTVPRFMRHVALVLLGLGLGWACGFDDTLREYLDARFWLPFSKKPWHFEKPGVRRASAPFAGMAEAAGQSSLAKLRAAYQEISNPISISFDVTPQRELVAAARAERSLGRREREEVDLIDAKIDLRAGEAGKPELLESARKKLEAFLRTARTPAFASEARGWLARVHYLLGNQTAAGKIYLDELNRDGSNLSRETLLNSLQLTYGHDGGPRLLADLDKYFDTPEHAAFAIQMVTNPRWGRDGDEYSRFRPGVRSTETAQRYRRVKDVLEKHSHLFASHAGANTLALLGMRTALRMGEPPVALEIAAAVPPDAAVRADPDFQWMLASASFLSHEFAAAEEPLLALFRSPRASANQKAAAAYALCGVYQKLANPVEQIRFALWLHTAVRANKMYLTYPSDIEDMSVYWAVSGWDLGLLLDAEAPIEALETFVKRYPEAGGVRVVWYSLAVRLAREDRYEESARIYESIHAVRRAPRMRRLAALYREAQRPDVPDEQRREARYRMAEFLRANGAGIYFNDALWQGFQNYALCAPRDSRLNRAEREDRINGERKLRDDQEERWRAYLILREVIRDAGRTDQGRRAARLAIRCIRGISGRFGRQEEIRRADIELSAWLRE